MNIISHLKSPAVFLTSLALAFPLYAGNPLATPEQKLLDEKAIEIYQNNSFRLFRIKAKAVYALAYGLIISSEAKPLLSPMVDELIFSSIQKAVNSDPYFPKVYWVDSGPRQWFGLDVPGGRYSYDNPDVIYRTIPIDGSLHYKIHGHREPSGLADASFSLISNPNSQGTVALLTNSELQIDADGNYEITIDSEPADGRINHIQSNDDAVMLFVRNSLGDWQAQKPDSLSVELLDDISGETPRSDTRIYLETIKNISESIFFYGVGALGIKTKLNPVNTFKQPEQSDDLGTLVSQASSFGHFEIEDDEALLLTVDMGGANYFIAPATGPWTITIDPGNVVCSLNNQQAMADTDGRYRFVLSLKDPGVYNWISTSGLHEGTMMLRWQNLPANTEGQGPAITSQLVKISDLPSILPPETHWVSQAERQQQILSRQSGYQSRSTI
ncbi:hypothetical protein Lqui_0507 [Legionella quinlivanii]|uniref:Uncharacterized protein n=1 Tax=Legionella quinlivanii TaxID=45073 RepID=A0A0W0Y4Q9_9GAMM|nr:DUF1214 domain-containing protein [Legionella quinlivanii]KTD51663.1 hypothetical protein Lqui_0507 [Legionella quinlivanii]MCW8451001.1 DUF1214 domain-containing protein [Legionella quinlivanii]SEF62330.1 Protein of unknown function [Legionella quinlivanii DSM 21216]STY10810.1 Uncharacterised protein [Legionella quinlivanii]